MVIFWNIHSKLEIYRKFTVIFWRVFILVRKPMEENI